jgi:hypothetical protein
MNEITTRHPVRNTVIALVALALAVVGIIAWQETH